MTEESQNIEPEEHDEYYIHHQIEVDKGQSPLRIDKFLMERIQNATRNKIQNAIKTQSVRVNAAVVKANYKVKPFDCITIAFPEPPRTDEIIPEDIPLDIVYEDETVLVLNKKPGMVVHPGYNNWSGTLVNALAYYFQNLPTGKNGKFRPGLVHRIDKDTSGLMVVAKTEYGMAHLARQFEDHSIERTYYALVWGEPEPAEGTINKNLARHHKDRRIMNALDDTEKGKTATTHYKTLESLRYVSLLQCRLETGRTHQIRAHMKCMGHPIFSDEAYGGKNIIKGTTFSKYKKFVENCFLLMPRQALHAKSLGFIHPHTEKFIQFDSALPDDFQMLMDKWKNYVHYNA